MLFVETVGVGQSEIAVSSMVDTFLLLTIAGSGDALQGIKKGIIEIADVIAVNKADGPYANEAEKAAQELQNALRLIRSSATPAVLTCSAESDHGLDEIWAHLRRRYDDARTSGDLDANRARQRLDWAWSMVRERLLDNLNENVNVAELVPKIEHDLRAGTITPTDAAERILSAFYG